MLTISRLIVTQPSKKCFCSLKILTVFNKNVKIEVEAKSYRVSETYHETKVAFCFTLLEFEISSKNGTHQIWRIEVFKRLENIRNENTKIQEKLHFLDSKIP